VHAQVGRPGDSVPIHPLRLGRLVLGFAVCDAVDQESALLALHRRVQPNTLLVLYLPRLIPTGRFLRDESTQGFAVGCRKQAAHGRSPEHFLRV
jgi:hypothetical protein